ncbi:hypothetical protein [Pasteurella multocida]|uniref:hypothetical protein n=1 Tax=Pasteurella multocida TaxID=747 RepID=UPI000C7E1808|nr:hypothetical protein [Pasteurella multocida]AUK27478.1 hypothetical protein A4205_01870 [Pasteurella multocida]AUK28675.1 hypothetical protein A4205_08365 [Pasteurella multocida]AUK55318.1 hypothetical protein A4209_01870 [Pasteurella multocida]AUK56513.1 hypothetical protein A4209_08370 [Pasteurella multocida]WLY63658.1 hypothetical protein RA306_07615 [Pasteurella multocida]
MEFELILSTESKVLACNIQDFKARAEKFLSTITSTFETDEDFGKAKEEVKLLKEVEDRTREAIKNARQGDIQELISQAEEIAEQFRQKRLFLDKTVKTREVEIKSEIVSTALDEVIRSMSGYENDVSIVLSTKYSRNVIKTRLEEATKRRSTIATLEKAVNAEKTLIVSEISAEGARVAERRKMIPISYEHLFKDWQSLISGEQDLEPIIKQRIAEEEKREAELKAKAEAEAREKAEAEAQAQAQAKAQAEIEAIQAQEKQSNMESAVEKTQEITSEPISDFVITIQLKQVTRNKAIQIARDLKAQFGDNVSLKPQINRMYLTGRE